MSRLIIDGNSVYEIDEECLREQELENRRGGRTQNGKNTQMGNNNRNKVVKKKNCNCSNNKNNSI